MNLSGLFIRRPVATSLLAFGLLLAGAIAFRFLPVSSLPEVEFPTIQVYASLPGADPITVASSLSAPLERRFSQIAGVSELTSSSVLGHTSINIQFDLGRSVDSAARDVQAAIDASLAELPADLVTRPGYQKVNPADSPILILAMTSDVRPPGEVYNFAYDVIAQRISQVEGVGQVQVSGAEKSAVRVQIDPGRLAAMGLSLEDVRGFLAKANADMPKGSLDGRYFDYALHVNDQLSAAASYGSLVAFHDHGSAVRVRDLGAVVDAVEDVRQAGWYNGKPAVLLFIYKQTSANVIETVDRIQALMPLFRLWLPPAIHLELMHDRTETIRASVKHIEITLLLSILLVVLVVFIFLRHFWATFIPCCSVPLSLAGTFGIMYLVGYTLDNLSLMALAVAVGFVVDDAIVVIENIFRHLEAGEAPKVAALNGARQIGFTILSMTLSLIAVFTPLIFMNGLIGRLLHEFALTLAASILVSGVVSLTFTPMMCGLFLRHQGVGKPQPAFFRGLEKGFNGLQQTYGRALRWVLAHPRLMLGVTGLTAAASVFLYIIVPKGFFPVQDTGQISCTVEAAQDISFSGFRQKDQQVDAIIRADPAVRATGGFISGGSNQGRIFTNLFPLEIRRVGVEQVIARLRRKIAAIEGVSLFMQPAQELRIGAHSTKSTYQYTMQGPDLKELTRWSDALLKELTKVPHFQDVTSDLQSSGLQARVVIDRAAAGRLGIAERDIDNTLYDAFGQRQVSTIYSSLTQHHVILEVRPHYQLDPAYLDTIYVKSSTGRMVPLSAITQEELGNTSLSVNHLGQFPAVTLSFNLDPGYSLSEATEEIEDASARLHIPGSIHGSFQGMARAFEQSLSTEPILILAALVAVYIILGMLYESLIHPLTILSTLPSAGVGALLALILCGYELSIVALIGIILLIGLVKKNAIMMIDFAIEVERSEGLDPAEAIYRACIVRFRPIMMTTMAALFGALPLALEGGVGAELHKPLGISIVGGLIFSQMLTLFTTPVVYLALDRMRRRHQRRRAVAPALEVPTHPTPRFAD